MDVERAGCFYKSIRLGDDHTRPEFSNFSWFAMLFSAGIGIGILLFGVAEPTFYCHYTEGWGYPPMRTCEAMVTWKCSAPWTRCG